MSGSTGFCKWTISSILLVSSIVISFIPLPAGAQQQIIGHVIRVKHWSLPNFVGCHAVVLPQTSLTGVAGIAALSSDNEICNIYTTALHSGLKIQFSGQAMFNPPIQFLPGWLVFDTSCVPCTVELFNTK
jgi:hypothetical protein